jgi:dolichyl-phosphate beta-glucosyltransferase
MSKAIRTISVIIPAYNEEKRLPKTLQKWQDFLNTKNNLDYKISEIIVVDDGSKDKTISVAQYFENFLPIKIIKIEKNQGKGNAIRAGVKKSFGDFIFIYDADAAVLPEEIQRLLAQTNNADIIIGSRTAKDSKTKMSIKRRIIGICFHILCYPLLPKIKDASCGAKLLKTNIAKQIFNLQKINRFAFDIEILWLAQKSNFKIKEVGVTWQEIPESKVNIFYDSIEMLFSVLRIYKKQIFG